MERLRKAVIVVAVVVGAALMAGYDGPALQAGEGVDRARDEDRVFGEVLIGEGRANVDRAVEGPPR